MKDELLKDVIEPGQTWEIDFFRPEDAEGVVRLFHTVYGDGYPVRTFTDMERLIEENASGRTISSVARTAKGDIVGHSALFPSAPFRGLYEVGAGLVEPDYRGKVIAFRLVEHSVTTAAEKFGVETLFGEPVCNHVVMQKICDKLNFVPCAVEVDLMPAAAYTKEKSASGRVATLLTFNVRTPKQQTICLPHVYEEMLRFIYDGIRHECRFVPSSAALPTGQQTRIDVQVFDFAQVGRFTVHEAGQDFAAVFDREEKAAIQKGTVVHQVWLKLSWPWVGHVVGLLRSRGYFIGGALPRWFDVDGLLMQKTFATPDWEGIQIEADRANRILEMVKADWETSLRVVPEA